MRIVVTGASGQLGSHAVRAALDRGHEPVPWSGRTGGHRSGIPLRPVDLTDPDAIASALDDSSPDAVLHAAAVSTAEGVRRDPAQARRVNVAATRRIAEWCRGRGARLVFTSTDMVFDGTRPWSVESAPPRPILEYGRTKAEAESATLAAYPSAIVARVCLLYGPALEGPATALDRFLAALRAGQSHTFFEDEFRTPLDYPTAAAILVRLAETGHHGPVHVGGPERMSRFDLMRRVAGAAGCDASLVAANRQSDQALPEPRPADVSLDTSTLSALLPDIDRPSIEAATRAFAGRS